MNARAGEMANSRMSATVVEAARTRDAFAALEQEWDELYERSGRANPFLSYAWTRACFDEEGAAAEPFVLTLRRRGKLIGIAPLCIETRFGFRVLRFIADARSDYLGFLADAGSKGIERRLMIELTEPQQPWDLVVLRNLAEPFTVLGTVEHPGSVHWHRADWTTSAYCRWDGDWDSLHENGPVWLKQMRNRRRRFLKNGRSVQSFRGSHAADRLDLVAKIEARSWKGRDGLARFQPGPGQEILRRAFLAKGSQLELNLAFTEETAIAFQIDFMTPDRLWMYQYSYDEDYSNLRAGSVIQYSSIDRAWQRGAHEYDLLMGDESYKANRTTGVRPIYCLAGHRPTLRGYLAYWLFVAPRWKLRRVRSLKLLQSKLKVLGRLVSR